jgi:D-tyrosyl-tRNA(Tyr) deacylase
MRLILQRSLQASVLVDGKTISQISHGLVILFGAAEGDNKQSAEKLAAKVANLRIFNDAEGKMNLNIKEVGGQILSVSQFTLLADTTKGNRPSFIQALKPTEANLLYELFNDLLRQADISVATGQFGAHMELSLINDGPVTIILEA